VLTLFLPGRGRRVSRGAVGETSRHCVYAALKRLGLARRRCGALLGLWESRRAPRCRRPRDGDLRRDVAPRSVHVVLERSRRARTSTAWRYLRPPASSAALEPLESHNILWPADVDSKLTLSRRPWCPRPQNDASGAARHLSWASCCSRAANVTRTVGRRMSTPNQPDRHSATPRPSYETPWHGPAPFDGPGAVAEP
jgi:signal recognition particle subunit SEC65